MKRIPQQKRPETGALTSLHELWDGQYYAGGASLGAAAEAAASGLFTKSFNSLLGLKNGIFFAGTSTFSPVFGFRPTRPRR